MTRARGRLIALPSAAPREVGDAGLVAACAAGDRAARALLFERYADAVHRFVRHLRVADDAAIDDVVQATFLAAFAAAARFRGDNARSWLFGIAAHRAYDVARSEQRRRRTVGALTEVTDAVASSDPYLRARLPEAIAALRPELRAALVLVDVMGERGVDAAAALGVPEGTLWRRVFEARVAVRQAIGGVP